MKSGRILLVLLAVAVAGAGLAAARATSVRFAQPVTHRLPGVPNHLFAVNVNGDRFRDLVAVEVTGGVEEGQPTEGYVLVLAGSATGRLRIVQKLAAGILPGHTAFVDLDGDGRRDLVTADRDAKGAYAFRARTGGFDPGQRVDLGVEPVGLLVADVTGDKRPDIIASGYDSRTVAIAVNDGSGHFAAPSSLPVDARVYATAAGRFDGDPNPDLFLVTTKGTMVAAGHGDGTFAAPLPSVSVRAPGTPHVADVNRDGRRDVVLLSGSRVLRVLFGRGDGTFRAAGSYAVPPWSMDIVIADANRDGRQDVFVTGATATAVLTADRAGRLRTAATLANGKGTWNTRIAHVNGDRRPDVMICDVNVRRGFVWMNGPQLRFARRQSFAAGGGCTTMLVANVNGDRFNDLVVGLSGSGGAPGISVLARRS